MLKSTQKRLINTKELTAVIIGKVTNQCNICGQNVRKLREEKKMSQDQLAAKLQTEGLGVNQNSISRIETGKRIVADYELKILAQVLNVPVDILLIE